MDIGLCIEKLIPSAVYGGSPGGTESEYNSIRWEDPRTKPTWAEIESVWSTVQDDIFNEGIIQQLDATDREISRKFEDYIDMHISLGTHTEDDMPAQLKAKYKLKKTLRAKLK